MPNRKLSKCSNSNLGVFFDYEGQLNKDQKDEVLFEFDDGGNNFNKGFHLSTNSIEVVINQLIEKGVNNDPKLNPFSRLK